MNKSVKSMNKINIDCLEYPQVRLDNVRMADDLQDYWKSTVLSGHFWRLYHNDRPGSGVFMHGRRLEMTPENIYILPPNCELKVWCDAPGIRQIYFHFEVSRLTGTQKHLFNRLPMTPEDKAVLDDIRQSISRHETSPRLDLQALALASGCLSRLPVEAVHELGTDRRVSRVCSVLRENPSRQHTLADMAHIAGMASNSFLRLFREITGFTPYQYLMNIRYSLAARLLSDTDAKIEEICELTGIKDRFHFSRVFKRFYGDSPASYRKSKRR